MLRTTIARVPINARRAASAVSLSLSPAARNRTAPSLSLPLGRPFSSSPFTRASGPNDGKGGGRGGAGGGGGMGGGGGGSPLGNIFSGQHTRTPGAALEEFSVDLSALARAGKLDPVIGRDEEMKRTIQILSRRTKCNALLVGQAGVGKTAIVEGLAQRLVSGEVPESLKGKRVLAIDLSGLMAGSAVRGSFEGKMKDLIQDLEDQSGEVIAFIDEIHQLLNLGQAEGSLSGSNMLKPALARGLSVVGATTVDEYRRTIEKDAALSRRFQPVVIEEPGVDQTITMLRGLKRRYELHHGLSITDAALVSAAVYSNRYIADRQLPDKAIDLIDEASSALRLARESKPEELETIERTLLNLQIELSSLGRDEDQTSVERRMVLEEEIKELSGQANEMETQWREQRRQTEEITKTREELEKRRLELVESQRTGDYQRAGELRYAIIPELEKRLPEDDSLVEVDRRGKLGDRVTSEDVARGVARTTGIPVSMLLKGDRSRVLNLENVLRQRVLGQEEALTAVAEAVRLSRAGLHVASRPVASFLFLGPSGVGKTELAKALAEEITGTEKNLININMSEYSERHTVARLIGSPPGYVGYEDAGQLTESVRRRPHSVVLLDEFEKADREVANLFLQVLDEGTLTDSQGRKVDFKNTILILTSNLGSDILLRPDSVLEDGTISSSAREEVLARVAALYPPELINRFDEQVIFQGLSSESIKGIVDLRIKDIHKALKSSDRKVTLLVEEGAREWLAVHGYSPHYGAREIARLVNKQIRQPLASCLLRGTIRSGDTARVRVNLAGDGLEVVPLHEAEVEKPADEFGRRD